MSFYINERQMNFASVKTYCDNRSKTLKHSLKQSKPQPQRTRATNHNKIKSNKELIIKHKVIASKMQLINCLEKFAQVNKRHNTNNLFVVHHHHSSCHQSIKNQCYDYTQSATTTRAAPAVAATSYKQQVMLATVKRASEDLTGSYCWSPAGRRNKLLPLDVSQQHDREKTRGFDRSCCGSNKSSSFFCQHYSATTELPMSLSLVYAATAAKSTAKLLATTTVASLLFCMLLCFVQINHVHSIGALIRSGSNAQATSAALSSVSFVRLCVTINDYDECLQMSSVSNGTITCVKARDRYECMKHIIDDKADVVNLNNEELYLAGRLYNLEPFAMEQFNGDTQHYKSVVVINNKSGINSIADLRGKRSCHGALNSTHGWDIPVGLLLATMTMAPDCRGELNSVSKFFDQSCAPGAWSSDSNVDAELKRLHPSLCAACQNSTLCSSSDEFAGDDGALRCLFSGYGQVAFTTSKTIERFLSTDRLDRRLMSQYVFLCLDGSKLSLDSKPCEWAHKPTNVFVTSPERKREKDWYLSYLQQLFFRYVPYKPSWWRMRSLFSDPLHVTQILSVPVNLQRWDKYLGNYISSIEKPLPLCELNSVTMCTTSPQEELKCLDLQKAAFSQRVRPEIDCARRASKQECLELVAKRQADLVAVDLSDLYEAPAALVAQLEPVGVAQGFTDYAVAVVRADSGIKFLYQLGGRRSCHAAFGDTASWLAPLAVLTERSLLEHHSCNKADQVAEYFGGSCVPGAADLRVNHYRSGSEKLCAVCRGDSLGLHQCERSTSERYANQAGALRCLVEGAGEVAFVSLSSLAANVDGRSQEAWARSVPLAMDSRNFRLVCRSGPSMPLGDYERCHLTKLPGKIMVTTKFTSKEDRLATRQLLTRLVDKFAGESRDMFELFGPYQNESDLLFDDSTNRIVPLKLDVSTFDAATRLHFDPSFQQISIANKDASCKVVLTTSAASSRARATEWLLGLVLLNCLGALAYTHIASLAHIITTFNTKSIYHTHQL